jgi:pyruvate/2-oxoglutarate dehydrogenase complex dihydrolipoamide dehydrogenase (E3) component
MVRRFGSGVTLIQRGPQLMPREDRDVADALRDVLVAEAIDVVLDAQVLRADRAGAGIRLTVAVQGAERGVDASHVLVAAGRAPATEALDLGRAGVETDAEGFVRVNDRLETTAAGVYAIGDVVRGPAFTHTSYDDFRILKANLIDGGRRSRAGRLVPYTVFTDPQLGRVGLTEQEARAEGRRVRVARLPMTDVARAIETDETRGVLKAVVDAETDRILGCAFLGADAGELMSIVQMAMLGDLPFTALRDGIFAHPTLAESLNNLFAALAD